MTKHWIVGTGSGRVRERLWEDCYNNNRIRIGFDINTDLSPYVALGEEALKAYVNSVRPENPGSADQCWKFAAEMTVGDKIVARKGRSTIVGLGEITSKYLFDENLDDYKQFRHVNWFPFDEEIETATDFSIDTVVELTEENPRHAYLTEILAVHNPSNDGGRYPFTSHSWTVFSPTVAVKLMDKSAFQHHGTGVPRDVSFFFDFDPDQDAKSILLTYSGKQYQANLSPDPEHQRVRLFWKSPLSKLIAELMPSRHQIYSSNEDSDAAPAEMRFSRMRDDVYSIGFLEPDVISADTDYLDDDLGKAVSRNEGRAIRISSTVYERDPQNRLDAIRIHGHRCVACGFDFGQAYGERGEGYIEVHHLTPLAEVDENHTVNPETDLAPVCANCHRMIHRRRDSTLSLKELKEIIQVKTTI
jgi:5-methylcytosine-specific restriction enzyme A